MFGPGLRIRVDFYMKIKKIEILIIKSINYNGQKLRFRQGRRHAKLDMGSPCVKSREKGGVDCM